VALAAPKGARADWAVEKLTELGVARILWLECERSVVKPRAGRLERWRRIAASAAQQCGRADLPEIEGPLALEDVLERAAVGLKLIAQRGEGGDLNRENADRLRPRGSPPDSARGVLLIGPEGGFTRHELESAKKAGYTSISLGIWTLRSETAAVAGAAALLGAFESGAP